LWGRGRIEKFEWSTLAKTKPGKKKRKAEIRDAERLRHSGKGGSEKRSHAHPTDVVGAKVEFEKRSLQISRRGEWRMGERPSYGGQGSRGSWGVLNQQSVGRLTELIVVQRR